MDEWMLIYIGYLMQAAIRAGTPLLLATLGEIYAERSGVLNLGVEGMMIMGAISAYVVAFATSNPWLGVIAAIIVGALFALIHAFVSISLKANQVVSGLALTMLGLGVSAVIGKAYVGTTLQKIAFSPIAIPILSEIPIIGIGLFTADPIAYIGIITAVVLWYILFKTKYGLAIRAVGENPAAADTLGINVFLVRYLCVALGGALAGLAGAHLSLAYTPSWIEGMTAGKGWIAVGLTIFAIWNPMRALVGSYIFGLIDVLQFRLQPYGIPPNILAMLPYLFTIIALLIGTTERMKKRIGAPAALCIPYTRGERK
ncbi:MAG: ABC transporter permease [Candidatus Odinarchaeota archaeon]|nr:ABC transporter permease [Candidatus Odinarchaeota archaeon]